MQRILTRVVVFVLLLSAATFLTAQEKKTEAPPESKPVEGTLIVGERTYRLSHVVAYETRRDDNTFISVLASDRKIPFDKIQAALRDDEGSDDRLSLDQPHVVITFRKSGEALWCKAAADGGSFTRAGESLTGKFKFENGRAAGESKLPPRKDAVLRSEFDLRWDVALGAEATPKPAAKPAGPVKPSITGTFKGNGKPAKLAFVSARSGEPFSDKASIILVFTEKDHSKEKKPDFKAGFGEFGSALIISVFEEDGKVFGCELAHAGHGNMPFSSVGNIRTSAFEVGDGRVEGEIQTDGEVKTFGKTWEINLKFVAPYTAPAPKQVAKTDSPAAKKAAVKPGKAKSKKKPDPDDEDEDADEDAAPAKDAGALNVKDLALPKDATDVVYKKIVEHMSFKCPTGVQALAGEFSKKLGEQGWKADKGGDLITAKSAILNRKRAGASLTIFVKPADKGSTVTIMTEGLDWEEK
jgi:hypothetical protein